MPRRHGNYTPFLCEKHVGLLTKTTVNGVLRPYLLDVDAKSVMSVALAQYNTKLNESCKTKNCFCRVLQNFTVHRTLHFQRFSIVPYFRIGLGLYSE